MDIIIVGCGKVGRALTEQLDEPGNNITVIDINGARATEVAERFDVMHVAGNGSPLQSRLIPLSRVRLSC